MFSLQRAWIQSLLGELKSYKMRAVAEEKRRRKKEIWVYFRLLIQLLAIFKVLKIYLNVYLSN